MEEGKEKGQARDEVGREGNGMNIDKLKNE